jgi:hypothetical protein
MRRKASPGSRKLHPLLTPQFHAYLKDLVRMGHGPTASDAARYLLQREFDDLLRAKLLKPRGEDGEILRDEN